MGEGSIMRNRLFGSRVRGPFTDCVLRAVFNERAKSLDEGFLLHPPARQLDHYRAQEDKTIATRTLRGEMSASRVPGDTFARGREINNYRGAREC